MSPLAALEILRAAAANGKTGTVATPEVKAALRKLKPLCPEQWPIYAFWDAAKVEHDIGRQQSLTASFNGIVLQLGLPRWASDG